MDGLASGGMRQRGGIGCGRGSREEGVGERPTGRRGMSHVRPWPVLPVLVRAASGQVGGGEEVDYGDEKEYPGGDAAEECLEDGAVGAEDYPAAAEEPCLYRHNSGLLDEN